MGHVFMHKPPSCHRTIPYLKQIFIGLTLVCSLTGCLTVTGSEAELSSPTPPFASHTAVGDGGRDKCIFFRMNDYLIEFVHFGSII